MAKQMAKQQEPGTSHHIISAVVTLVAVVALVAVFQSNGPTANIVEMVGNPKEESGGWKITKYLDVPGEDQLESHNPYCRHFPGDLDYRQCCPGGRKDEKCTDPCPRTQSSSPTATDLTGNCCIQINRAPRCETFGDVFSWQGKYSKECIPSPTQEGVILC